MYMATVFGGGDIVKQLPAEARRFQNIDKAFMQVCTIFSLYYSAVSLHLKHVGLYSISDEW